MSLSPMKGRIESALDDLVSPRSTSTVQGAAIFALEETIAETLLQQSGSRNSGTIIDFLQLQDTFQCNIASRVLAWLSRQIEVLKRGDSSDEEGFQTVIAQVMQSLSLLQGAALLHTNSKTYLSRKYPMEVLLELLSASRHAVAKPFNNSTNTVLSNDTQSKASPKSQKHPPSLASVTLDTLLCVLVDMPDATRTFEECNGIELIVKTLKRASIPRDVRMKCLEFLYFYLMDENASGSKAEETLVQKRSYSPTKSAPSSYTESQTMQHSAPHQPSSSEDARMISSRSKSNSAFSSSFSSWSPTPTLAETPPQSPTKRSSGSVLKSSSSSTTTSYPHRQESSEQSQEFSDERGALAMLRSDVDFVPLSPKKPQISKLGYGASKRRIPGGPGTPPPRFPLKQQMILGGLDGAGSASGIGIGFIGAVQQRKPSPLSRESSEQTLLSADGDGYEEYQKGLHSSTSSGADDASLLDTRLPVMDPGHSSSARTGPRTRTIEEKKETLGQLLGNVDALVEGIKKAGIWGLAG